MTGHEFLNKIGNGKEDFLQKFLDILRKNKIKFCVIGGLGVNAYVEPVVSLDLDLIIVADKLQDLVAACKKYKVQEFPLSINISSKHSDLRIQIQTDLRYQLFFKNVKIKEVLGYKLPVASMEEILQGKIWAAMDGSRRPSKRQKDLADILRLLEAKSSLKRLVPKKLLQQLLT